MAIVNALESGKVPYAITGALAAGCYGVPRATKDVDLFIPTGLNARKLIACVRKAGFTVPSSAAKILRSGGILTLKLPSEKFEVDLIVSDEVADAITHARVLSLYGRKMKVVSPEDLVVIKLAAWRLQDRPDAIRVAANQWEKLDIQRMRNEARKWGVERELEKLLRTIEKVKAARHR